MRYLHGLFVALVCAASLGAQEKGRHNALNAEEAARGMVLIFDGQTMSGWIIDGDAEVKDGVLILGGAKPTRARIAVPMGATFKLHLEYRTENKLPVNFDIEHKRLLGSGSSSRGIDRVSNRPDEWLEGIYFDQEKADHTWSVLSKWRGLGEPAFKDLEVAGSSEIPGKVVLAYQIPAGQRLYLRTVRLKTEPLPSIPWLWLGLTAAFVVALLALCCVIVWKKRGAKVEQHAALT